ncbi:transposase [Streptomyces sp. NBC_01618]|uniref:transposase n=1 Tax=Streptomyces sp. NBC_01618 TaxID=2975900 RepID=UPI00386F40FF
MRASTTRYSPSSGTGLQEAIQQVRVQEDTRERSEQYAHRAGAEGTISQEVRAFGLRRCRYHGPAEARLAAPAHLRRDEFLIVSTAWWTGTPRARTRISHLAVLRPIAQNTCSSAFTSATRVQA